MYTLIPALESQNVISVPRFSRLLFIWPCVSPIREHRTRTDPALHGPAFYLRKNPNRLVHPFSYLCLHPPLESIHGHTRTLPSTDSWPKPFFFFATWRDGTEYADDKSSLYWICLASGFVALRHFAE